MITLVTGKIGSGKTIFCVEKIIGHIANGGTVYTNIDLNWDNCKKLILKRYKVHAEDSQLQPIDLVKCAEWHKTISWGTRDLPVLCVLDEIHLFFNARDWSKTADLHRDMLSFLSQSRKACVDIIFIAQVATTLEKQFRVQSQYEFSCVNLKDLHIPLIGKLNFNKMLLTQKDNAEDAGRVVVLGRWVRSYDKELFPCYDTAAFLDANMREAAEQFARVPRVKLKRKASSFSVATLILFVVLLLVWLVNPL